MGLRVPAIALAMMVGLGGCVLGAGETVDERREVGGFDEVVLATSGSVEISVTGTDSLLVEAEENILPLLTTEVVDGRLLLGSSKSFTSRRGVHFLITVDTLDGVEISGSGDVMVRDYAGDRLSAVIGGSGTVGVEGTCGSIDVVITGSGDVDAEGLICDRATVLISGSGDAVVHADDRLDATVAGSGSVRYSGDPEVRSTVTGSGSVEQTGRS